MFLHAVLSATQTWLDLVRKICYETAHLYILYLHNGGLIPDNNVGQQTRVHLELIRHNKHTRSTGQRQKQLYYARVKGEGCHL